MTEKLDPFGPSLESLSGIKHQLLRAGIPEHEIPHDWLPTIIAATNKWLTTTEDGLRLLSRLFCFDLKYAEDDKDYLLVNNANGQTISLENKQVAFFSGALVNGRPVAIADPRRKGPIPPVELEISETTKTRCDDCGIVSHCIKEILEPFSDSLRDLCNNCRTYHEHPKVNELGSYDACRKCSSRVCRHHPASNRKYSAG